MNKDVTYVGYINGSDIDQSHPDAKWRRCSQEIANRRAELLRDACKHFGITRSKQGCAALFIQRLCGKNKVRLRGRVELPNLGFRWDHARTYTKEGKPFAAVFHLYDRLHLSELKSLTAWCEESGLEVQIDADSEYYPGVTLRLAILRAGERFPSNSLA